MWSIDVPDARRPDVLVATDDDDVCTLVLDAIGSTAGTIAVAHHARHALARTHEGGFDAVMVDLAMPQGWALLRLLAAFDHAVVALAPTVDERDIQSARELGASVVLPAALAPPAVLRVALARALNDRAVKARTLAAV